MSDDKLQTQIWLAVKSVRLSEKPKRLEVKFKHDEADSKCWWLLKVDGRRKAFDRIQSALDESRSVLACVEGRPQKKRGNAVKKKAKLVCRNFRILSKDHSQGLQHS